MTQKTVYIWGPVSSFTGALVAFLLQKDWHVHLATKSSLNLFTMAPLDLRSSAQSILEKALGSHERLKIFQDRLRFLDPGEISRSTTYDAAVFCGLPPNFDEPRVPRAPWVAGEVPAIAKRLKGVPLFLVSSLWGGIQPDGAVPEELTFDRRKPLTHWEGICQQYESKLLKAISHIDAPWHLIRLPMLTGSTQDGKLLNFSGLFSLLREIYETGAASDRALTIKYNPDSTLWFLPVDTAVHLFWRLLEDGRRPRICNLVSTQSTLNREWMQYLAQAFGCQEAVSGGSDPYNLPGVFRRMLKDEISIKTRNLFEVAARYQQSPTRLDKSYFERLIEFGKAEHWGRFVANSQTDQLSYSEDLALNYFKDFLPENLNGSLFKELTEDGTTVGFHIEGPQALSFLLKGDNGQTAVELLDTNASPSISVHFSGHTMTKLIQNKLSLHQALLLRKVLIEGQVLDIVRIGNSLNSFFSQHPYQATTK